MPDDPTLPTDLRACPFCGGGTDVGSVHWETLQWFVMCGDCEAQGPVGETEEAAIAAWNQRAISPERHRQIQEEVREELGGYTSEDDY